MTRIVAVFPTQTLIDRKRRVHSPVYRNRLARRRRAAAGADGSLRGFRGLFSIPRHSKEGAMLALYMSPGSSSMATHIMLHEIGVDFESRWLSFAKREQHAPEYLALNPMAKSRPCWSTGIR
jgi:hypothetical protein